MPEAARAYCCLLLIACVYLLYLASSLHRWDRAPTSSKLARPGVVAELRRLLLFPSVRHCSYITTDSEDAQHILAAQPKHAHSSDKRQLYPQ
jgi:hypothetical protein